MAFFSILSAIISAIVGLVVGVQLLESVVNLVTWTIYGIVAGSVARFALADRITVGFWQSFGLGIIGSFVGGFVKYVLGFGFMPFESSGLVAGCFGAVLLLYLVSLLNKNEKVE